MNKLNSFKVASAKTASQPIEVPVNHIFVIDCSGSMCYDLPKIRTQMKNKLPSLLKQDDTVSLVWFSGKGEFGKLVEKIKVNDLNDLNRLNTAIDRWLQPMGCTGFVEPLQSVKELCNTNDVYSMMFLTDGCDNEWSRNQIINASEELATLLANAVFVEYGFYCNHQLLTEMADATNGAVVFAEDFDKYDPIFDGICKRKITNKRIEVEVGTPVENFVWSCGDAGAITYKVDNGKVYVPEDVDEVFWFTDESDSTVTDWKALYQGLSALALNRKSEFVRKQLSDIGDVALYNQYSNAFGKQNLYDFAEMLRKAGEDDTMRFTQGKQTGLQPKEDAYTVLNLLYDLKQGDAQVDMSKLHYNRIGRATEMSAELSKKETEALTESIANSSSIKEIKEYTDEAVRLATERSKMRFASSNSLTKISSFSYNETRPNVSMLFNLKGTVGLPSDAPSALPHDFPTTIFRNYTVIKDGLLNIEQLPVVVAQNVIDKLKLNGVPMKQESDGTTIIDLRSMPIINAKMVKSVNAQSLADAIHENMSLKASVKVYKGFLEEVNPAEKSQDIKARYGEECAEYLKSVGITDSGFNPKTTLSKPTDKYTSVEFAIKFKGLSTIPSYNALLKKLSTGKSLTVGEQLLKPAYDECVKQKSALSESDFIDWLEEQIRVATNKANALYEKIIEDKFSIIIGQTWFSDLDVNNPTLVSNGVPVTFEIKDVEVEI
jgi:hypothetical protein